MPLFPTPFFPAPRRLLLLAWLVPAAWLIPTATVFADSASRPEAVCRADSSERRALDSVEPLDLAAEEHALVAEPIGAILEHCPDLLAEYHDLALALDAPGFWGERFPALARAIDERPLVDRLPLLPTLWALEFRLLPIERHAELRRRVEGLVPRIRALDRRQDDAWWRAVIAGHEVARAEAEAERSRAQWHEARPQTAGGPVAGEAVAATRDTGGAEDDATRSPEPARRPYLDTRFLHFQDAIEPLRDWDLEDRDGREWTVEAFEGKATLVNFWATWCTPCLAEMPLLQELHESLEGDDRLQVLTVNVDRERLTAWHFLRGDGAGWSFPVARADRDLRGSVSRLPQTWLVDPEGVVRRKNFGFAAGVDPERWIAGMRAELERLLEP